MVATVVVTFGVVNAAAICMLIILVFVITTFAASLTAVAPAITLEVAIPKTASPKPFTTPFTTPEAVEIRSGTNADEYNKNCTIL